MYIFFHLRREIDLLKLETKDRNARKKKSCHQKRKKKRNARPTISDFNFPQDYCSCLSNVQLRLAVVAEKRDDASSSCKGTSAFRVATGFKGGVARDNELCFVSVGPKGIIPGVRPPN